MYSFGGPKIGNMDFKNTYEKYPVKCFRIANTDDEFTQMPTSVSPNFRNAKKPFYYTHVGELLSFSSNGKSVSNNHTLYMYLKNLPQ